MYLPKPNAVASCCAMGGTYLPRHAVTYDALASDYHSLRFGERWGRYDFEETQVLIKERGMSGQFHAKHSFTFGLERQTSSKGNWLRTTKAKLHYPGSGSPAARAELTGRHSNVSVTHRFL